MKINPPYAKNSIPNNIGQLTTRKKLFKIITRPNTKSSIPHDRAFCFVNMICGFIA